MTPTDEAARAREVLALANAAEALLRVFENSQCEHEEAHRGGVLWTICDGCGQQWADDKGGFKPYVEPAESTALRSAITAIRSRLTAPTAPTVAEMNSPDYKRTIVASVAEPTAQGEPLPEGVFWNGLNDNFYLARTSRGMGTEFYKKWRSRAAEFPTTYDAVRPTPPAAGRDWKSVPVTAGMLATGLKLLGETHRIQMMIESEIERAAREQSK